MRDIFVWVSALIRLDLPTFDRPIRAIFGSLSFRISSSPTIPLMNIADFISMVLMLAGWRMTVYFYDKIRG